MSKRQPWNWDETVLVLEAHLSGAVPTEKDQRVVDLTELLPHSSGSVRALLRNFHFLDREKTSGAPNVSKTTQRVWDEFSNDRPRLRSVATVLRQQAQEMRGSSRSQDPESMNDVTEAPEGKIATRFHMVRERNPGLVKRKKQRELKRTGRLVCEACRFDFAERYGERGKEFIECHHTKPLSDLKRGAETRLNDLALLCSNCHRMIHVRRPWLEVADLKMLIDRRAPSS